MSQVIQPSGAASTSNVLRVFNVQDYGALGDGTTDDSTNIQAAVDACATNGGVVFFPESTYLVHTPIKPKSNVTLRGVGVSSILITDVVQAPITWDDSSGSVSNIVIESLAIKGTVNQTVSTPTRARTTSGTGANIGVLIQGSLDPTGTYGVVTNVKIRNILVENTTWLPIKVFGSTNVEVDDCDFINCMDAGFGFNDGVRINNNYSYMSADNGFSVSRGNLNVAFTNNVVRLCAYDAFWFSGFLSAVGPNKFTCTGNTAYNFGVAGIRMIDAPSNGTISGNLLDGNFNRGASDEATDSFCVGIMVRGDTNAPSSPAQFATTLNIVGNTVRQCPRAGIMLDGAKAVKVASNLITDIGTQFLADGSSVVASNSTTQNIGIFFDQVSTYTNVFVENNTIIDTRATPYCNYAIQPNPTAGVSTFGNRSAGMRNTQNLVQNFFQGDTLSLSTANDITLASNGTDLTAAVNGRLQLAAGNSNGVLSGFNINNPNTGSSTGSGMLFSAGTNTSFTGGVFSARTDAATNSIVGMRVLSNSALTASSTSAAFYLQGAASGVTANFNANLTLATAGNKLNIATGSNASAGTAVLVGGTVTVNTTAITASSIVLLTCQVLGTVSTAKALTKGTVVAGTSFVITSADATDTSTVGWLIIN